jgi:hypothetical protein
MEEGKVTMINIIVSVGSVDGICSTAAVLRTLAEKGTKIVFTQAFTVDRIDPSYWEPKRNVLFVDLAVNNRDESMTVDFLRRIKAAGHEILGVLDEHSRENWNKAFADAGLSSFNDLLIEPVSQATSDIKSSGGLLLSFSDFIIIDEHARNLCLAADAGDRMDFTTQLGGWINKAVKSNITDDSRRVYLAEHFAWHTQPDETILGWIAEYDEILANHQKIISTLWDIYDNGIVARIIVKDRAVDMTTLMSELYKLGYSVVMVDGMFYNKSARQKTRQISFGAKPGLDIDIVNILKSAGIVASGFASKANVEPENEVAALVVLRPLLQ